MKLTVALVAAWSAGEAVAFLPPSGVGPATSSTSAAAVRAGRNTCTVQMKANGEAGGMDSVVGQQQPMGRKQILQSVAASGLGAVLFAASPSVADTAVDYAKVR